MPQCSVNPQRCRLRVVPYRLKCRRYLGTGRYLGTYCNAYAVVNTSRYLPTEPRYLPPGRYGTVPIHNYISRQSVQINTFGVASVASKLLAVSWVPHSVVFSETFSPLFSSTVVPTTRMLSTDWVSIETHSPFSLSRPASLWSRCTRVIPVEGKGRERGGPQCCQVLPKFFGQPSEKIRPLSEMMEKAG